MHRSLPGSGIFSIFNKNLQPYMTQKYTGIFVCFILLNYACIAQAWKLKLSSNVELRTWKLTNKAEKEEKALGGASIKLLSGSSVVNEINSKPNGDFSIEVPANGDYMLEVSYAGCNTKRFAISTRGVSEKVANDNFKPSYSIGGFIMAKPLPGIDYSSLKNPLLKVTYQDRSQKFDNDEDVTERGLKAVSKIADMENELVNKFCDLNKAGDAALSKNDCPLAKSNYEKAIALLQGEQYPVNQLVKVGDCLKQKDTQKDADKKVIEDAVAKAKADKAEKEAAERDKLVLAAAQAAQKKAAEEKALENKSKPTAPAQENPKPNAAPVVNSVATPTSNGVLKIKPKSEKELKQEAKRAKQREGMAKSTAEDKEAMQKDFEKAEERRLKKKQEAAEKAKKEREGMAAAEAKIIEEDKAEAAKKWEAKQKAEAEREKERKEANAEKQKAGGNQELDESEYKTPQPLGVNKYKEAITKADDYFKTKRYAEAKKMYEEALTLKANDAYAISRLAEIAKMPPTNK